PCIGICTANSKGYCKGCLRSRDERMYWAKLSNIDRRKVIRLCAARKRKLLDAMRKNAAADETNIAPQMDDLFD
ncbi:MAG: DUF1289 domain-containing protein, partial [Neisseriaceae bacterium]|nr:DUF1289 domain-containing protein [Neisseriaceae bacterium]